MFISEERLANTVNIVYFCYNLSGTGPRVRAQNVINGMAEKTDHNVVVLTNEPEKVTDSCEIHTIELSSIHKVAWKSRQVFSEADIVHVPINIYQVLFVRMLYFGPLVAGIGPGIQWEHRHRLLGKAIGVDYKIQTLPSDTRWTRYRFKTATCTATIDTEKFYRYSAERIQDLRDEWGISADTVVLYVGELTKGQGAHIVDEMARREANNDDIEFIIAGDGPLASRFRDRDDLRFEGFVDNKKLPDYYNVADVLAATRKYDVTSNVGLESIACGTPVITTAKGTIEEVFRDRGTYVWADRTPEAVLDTVIELMEDEERYEAQVQRGFEPMSEMNLTLSSAIETHLDVYEELAEL